MYDNLILLFFIFIFGLVLGSFLNVIIFRLEKEQFILGRSKCPNCKKNLRFLDLIPVLSFLLLRGKCHYCHEKISWQYPLIELTAGFAIVAIFLRVSGVDLTDLNKPLIFGLNQFLDFIFYLFCMSALIIIFAYDLKHLIIPNKVIYFAVAISLFYWLLRLVLNGPSFDFKPTFFSILFSFAFFAGLFFLSKGKWIGAGDVKFSIFIAFIIPWPHILITLFMSFVLGAILGLILVLLKKKKMTSKIPFGPFLAFSTFLTIFFGDAILNWYLGLLA
jgi:leader peptidase (prepilin peptidase)/N-methyltransferase